MAVLKIDGTLVPKPVYRTATRTVERPGNDVREYAKQTKQIETAESLAARREAILSQIEPDGRTYAETHQGEAVAALVGGAKPLPNGRRYIARDGWYYIIDGEAAVASVFMADVAETLKTLA